MRKAVFTASWVAGGSIAGVLLFFGLFWVASHLHGLWAGAFCCLPMCAWSAGFIAWMKYPGAKDEQASTSEMSKARQLAKGQPCMIGIAGTCNGDPETTVFARYPMDVYFDIEMSSDDELGAWACSACNAVLVRRPPILEEFFLQLRLFHAEGVLRTQHAIREMDR